MATQHIENKLKLLPDQPGCYLMKVTTDGTTLLGADDKAGVAGLLAVQYLKEHLILEHGALLS